ncbi:hypothetical protein [Microbacterium invictum]|uniref:Chaperone protein DnaK n=1 Tax=Microbacterium invictum TaxID=515415 RepID=A0ABZ0V9U2_9MICO|nr:hypothetical protein [Microbacterium invictum]WQB70244.1 hypothetical protein T9R20_16330 [Microbacterium invictum]
MGTPYAVAIDPRDESTSVAVAERLPDGALAVRPVLEGPDGGLPTTVFIGNDDVVFGEAALELGRAEPDRLIDGFVSRVADAGAFFDVQGERLTPPQLLAWVVDDIIHRVTELMGSAPASIGVLVPHAWSDARLAALEEELRADGHRTEFLDRLDSTALAFARSAPFFGSRTIVSAVADDTSVEAAVLRIGGDGVVNRLADPVTIGLDAGLDHGKDAADVGRSILAALAGTDRDLDDVDAVVLSGESAVVEPIASTVARQVGRPIEAVPHVGAFAAVGAAWDLSAELGPGAPLTAVLPSSAATASLGGTAVPTAISSTSVAAGSGRARSRRWIAVSVAVGAVIAVVGGASALALGAGGSPEVDDEVPAVVAPTRSPAEREDPASPSPSPTSPASVTPTPTSTATSETVVDEPAEATERRSSARPTPSRSSPVASTPAAPPPPPPASTPSPSPSATTSPSPTPTPEPSETSSPSPEPTTPPPPPDPPVTEDPEPGEPEEPTDPVDPEPGDGVSPGATP